MLDRRDAYSGATAWNGGHITPPLYHDYLDFKKNTAQRSRSISSSSGSCTWPDERI
ncbi:hypothetical protein EV421DRAFT_1815320, partial [Armillaria borealis]